MAEKNEGGLAGLFGKAEKWLEDQGITKETLEKAKADHDAREAEQEDARDAEQRSDRAARAGDSRVTLSGMVSGTIESGLAASSEQDGDQLFVTVEAVDPVQLQGGTFVSYTFSIPGYKGDGTYDLGTEDRPGGDYELSLDGQEEGFFWAREYGPGVVTVSDGGKTMQARFTYRDPGSNQVDLEGTVHLS